MSELATDHQGFLKDAQQWTEQWGQQCAQAQGIEWDAIDLEIVLALRAFYFEYDLSPAMRPLVKHLKKTIDAQYTNSMWLMHRYGESPARSLALISGLPKPKNCL